MKETHYRNSQDDFLLWTVIAVIVLVLFVILLPALPFLAFFLLLRANLRLQWWHLTIPAAILLLLLFFTGTGNQMVSNYINILKTVATNIKANRFSLANIPWLQILPVAFSAGLVEAAGIALLLEYRNELSLPQKNNPNLVRSAGKPTWWEKRKLAKLSEAKHPETGVLIGLSEKGQPVALSDRELNQHCLVVGTTGSGKTTTIMNIVESAVSREIPLVIVDGKGAYDLAERVKGIADTYARPFYLFSMRGNSMHYNPLARGGVTELKDKLISLTEWSEEHYMKLAERYLQLLFRCLSAAGVEKVDLAKVVDYLEPDALAVLAREIETDTDERNRILDALDSFSDSGIQGLGNRIAVITESEIGHLFRDEGPEKTIELAKAIDENAVVMFLLDSLSFPEYSRLLGRLVVTDLKGAAARQPNGAKKIYTIFDEFNVFASRAVVDLIGKARSFGFHTVIGTQSPSDLEAAGGPALLEQIIENCNTYIIQRQNSATNAEKLASIIGTEKSHEVTYQVQNRGLFGSSHTGLGSVRQTKEFIVHPDEIKRLGTGEAILLRKASGFKVERIRVRQIKM